MAQVKTAVSIDEMLFAKAESLAKDLQLSRSSLFARALREFIEREENQRMLDQLNAVYDGTLDPEDEALLRGMRRYHRQILARDEA